jgi:hypothetical protein
MNRCDVPKMLAAGALCLCLSGLAAPAAAQNSNSADGGGVTREATRDDRRDTRLADDREEDRDWGWLGLLGLAGLLGLMPRKRVPVVVNRDQNDVRRER